jgi:hypothetical protein
MKIRYSYLLSILVFAIFSVSAARAQSSLSMGLTFAQPTEDLADLDYRNGFGFYMEAMSDDIRTRLPLNLQFGGRVNVNVHGSETIETTLMSPFPGPGEFELTNQSAGFSGVVRLITPAHHRVRVYADGFAGSTVFYASESLTPTYDHPDYDVLIEEDCVSDVVQNSWGFHYGVAGGLMVRISPNARIDLRTSYTQGSNLEFVNLGSLQQVEQNIFDYHTRRSALDMLQFQLGISFDMNTGCTRGRPH